MQHVMAATATMSNGLKGSLSVQHDETIGLPSILKTPESAELVFDIGQQPACDIIEAIAGERPKAVTACRHACKIFSCHPVT